LSFFFFSSFPPPPPPPPTHTHTLTTHTRMHVRLFFYTHSVRFTARSFHISRLAGSVVNASGVSNITFTGIEIRYARGAGVTVWDSTGVVVRGCTVSDNGMMGVNITNG
jgi:hypothetical protein